MSNEKLLSPKSIRTFKLIILGDTQVGKTSILKIFLNSYESKYINNRNVERNIQVMDGPTIGIEFYSKVLELDDILLKVNIWDTSGHNMFTSIINSYLKECQGIILVYDITNRSSFNNLEMWLERAQRCKIELSNSYMPIMVIGNKKDCEKSPEKRKVTFEELACFADEKKLIPIEMSLSNTLNIEKAITSYIFNACKCEDDSKKRRDSRDWINREDSAENIQEITNKNRKYLKENKCCGECEIM